MAKKLELFAKVKQIRSKRVLVMVNSAQALLPVVPLNREQVAMFQGTS